jgi:hypothetical protein
VACDSGWLEYKTRRIWFGGALAYEGGMTVNLSGLPVTAIVELAWGFRMTSRSNMLFADAAPILSGSF